MFIAVAIPTSIHSNTSKYFITMFIEVQPSKLKSCQGTRILVDVNQKTSKLWEVCCICSSEHFVGFLIDIHQNPGQIQDETFYLWGLYFKSRKMKMKLNVSLSQMSWHEIIFMENNIVCVFFVTLHRRQEYWPNLLQEPPFSKMKRNCVIKHF